MVRAENIHSKLESLRRYRHMLDRYASMGIKAIQDDADLKGATERYLFLSVQAAIDLAEMVCKFQALGRPESMSHAFELMCQAGIISQDLSGNLIRMVGFRNALVHGYENLDYGVVEEVLRDRLTDLDRFASSVEKTL